MPGIPGCVCSALGVDVTDFSGEVGVLKGRNQCCCFNGDVGMLRYRNQCCCFIGSCSAGESCHPEKDC